MAQEQLALQWVADEQKKLGIEAPTESSSGDAVAVAGGDAAGRPPQNGAPGGVRAILEQKDRAPLKLSLAVQGKKKKKSDTKKKKKKAAPLDFWADEDDEDDAMEE